MMKSRWVVLWMALGLGGITACGDSGGDPGPSGDSGTADDGGSPGDDGGVAVTNDGLETPATATLATGPWPGGTAQVCQDFVQSSTAGLPSAIEWSFVDGNCIEGNFYLDFNVYDGSYDVVPGAVLLPGGAQGMEGDPVEIVTASHGTIDSGALIEIPEDTEVTITTHEWTIVFTISGNMVTISGWDPV